LNEENGLAMFLAFVRACNSSVGARGSNAFVFLPRLEALGFFFVFVFYPHRMSLRVSPVARVLSLQSLLFFFILDTTMGIMYRVNSFCF
jgi:hypothetical protein